MHLSLCLCLSVSVSEPVLVSVSMRVPVFGRQPAPACLYVAVL